MIRKLKPLYVLGAIAIAAIALWPFYQHRFNDANRIPAPSPSFTMAPVTADYLARNKVIAFYERRITYDSGDFISLNQLSNEYLQRYRETGDIGDVVRAEAIARRSIKALPHRNDGAQYALVSSLSTLHRFHDALNVLESMQVHGSAEQIRRARTAGIELELGHYERAKALLDAIPRSTIENASADTVRARYAELTGSLQDGRTLITLAQQQQDSMFDAPAVARAWYHERQGEMAFNSGDTQAAMAKEREALAIFPAFSMANNALARFALAAHDYRTAYTAATDAAAVVPLPETLGYQADAAEALGRHGEALRIRDLIFTVDRIDNAYHTSDRLLAVYYSEHRIRLTEAVAIAKREIAVRGDEIYAQDTLAWADAMNADWQGARTAIARAIRFDTEDPRLQYHAGAIAFHFGDKPEAKRRLMRALALNPQFHPFYAEDARQMLRRL